MNIGTPEILASILIFFALIKLIVILISPRGWLALVLAAIVLYFLVKSGITIVHIFAVLLFIALFIVAGIAPYSEKIVDWAMAQDMKVILKQQWYYSLVWFLLMLWCIQEIFFP